MLTALLTIVYAVALPVTLALDAVLFSVLALVAFLVRVPFQAGEAAYWRLRHRLAGSPEDTSREDEQ